jgi:hypothetical protein
MKLALSWCKFQKTTTRTKNLHHIYIDRPL